MWEEGVEKAIDVEAKVRLQPPSRTRKIDSRCRKSYRPSSKKEKDKVSQKHQIEIKTKLSPTTPRLLTQVYIKSRSPRKTNVMEAFIGAIQSLGSISLRLPRKIKIKIKPKIWAISNAILTNKRVSILISVLKSQKLVVVLATSISIIGKKTGEELKRLSYI